MWSFDLAEIKGDIEGFPPEIVELMLTRQVEQGQKKDITVFQEARTASYRTDCDGGFTWSDTIEKHDFWNAVIDGENFDLFFEKYPKTTPHPEIPQQDFKEIMAGFKRLREERLKILT